jgi:hypothetical protein
LGPAASGQEAKGVKGKVEFGQSANQEGARGLHTIGPEEFDGAKNILKDMGNKM